MSSGEKQSSSRRRKQPKRRSAETFVCLHCVSWERLGGSLDLLCSLFLLSSMPRVSPSPAKPKCPHKAGGHQVPAAVPRRETGRAALSAAAPGSSQGVWGATALETRWAEKAESHPTVPALSSPSRFPLAGATVGPEAQEEEEEEICSWCNKEAGLIQLRFDPMRVEGL